MKLLDRVINLEHRIKILEDNFDFIKKALIDIKKTILKEECKPKKKNSRWWIYAIILIIGIILGAW